MKVINYPPKTILTLVDQSVSVGTSVVYDLSSYIVDPENNAVTYLNTSSLPSYVTLIGSIFTISPPLLTPQTSNVLIQFSANDGAMTSSFSFYLSVINLPPNVS